MKLNLLKTLALLAAVCLATQLVNGQCISPPAGVVGWWPGDGNCLNVVGTNNGTANGAVSFAPGMVGQSFVFAHDGDSVTMPDNPVFNLQPAGFTAEFWMRGTKNQPQSLFDMVDKSHGWIDYKGWVFQGDSASGKITFYIGRGDVFVGVTSGDVLDGTYHHLAGTWDGSVMRFYVDGILQGQAPMGTPANNTRQVYLGCSWGNGATNRFYRGQLDELTICQRALTADEIAALYASGSAGQCKPQVSIQPGSQVGYWGKGATFTATVTNMTPTGYQWFKDSMPVSGATAASLVLTNLQSTNAGSYTVVVFNATGNALTSAPATLTVDTAGVNIALYAGVTIDGVAGQTYGIQSLTNLNYPNTWVGRTNLTLPTPIFLWYDTQPTTAQPQSYYRVVPGPITIP